MLIIKKKDEHQAIRMSFDFVLKYWLKVASPSAKSKPNWNINLIVAQRETNMKNSLT